MPHNVRVNKANTTLPNGLPYTVNQTAILSDEQFAKLSATAFAGGTPTLTDLGVVGLAGDSVTTQAAHVAITSTQAAAAPTQAQYNALQTDVANIQAALVGANKPMS
jgi:hypothetical protein